MKIYIGNVYKLYITCLRYQELTGVFLTETTSVKFSVCFPRLQSLFRLTYILTGKNCSKGSKFYTMKRIYFV